MPIIEPDLVPDDAQNMATAIGETARATPGYAAIITITPGISIAGQVIHFYLKNRRSDADIDAVISKDMNSPAESPAGGIALADDGSLQVQLSAADTAPLTAPAFLPWKIVVTISGADYILATGALEVDTA